jgi:divalent metal cation (Fe/Co/Zn/Cd) transporter
MENDSSLCFEPVEPPAAILPFDPMARATDVRRALGLVYVTLIWMTIEGAVSLILGLASKSLLLQSFGIDSAIELFSGGVSLWRLRAEQRGGLNIIKTGAIERQASKLAGFALLVLTLYVLVNSIFSLRVGHRSNAVVGVWGIGIGLVATIGMPILARRKLEVAARLNSAALRADAMEAITCGYLSIVLIAGLAATWLLGWWWLDSVAALVLVPFLIKEGIAAIRGTGCCRSGCKEGAVPPIR